jgi:hypothetical protein
MVALSEDSVRPPYLAAHSSADRPAPEARAEHRLLLACARRELDSEARDGIRAALAGPLDWEYLVRLAGEHGVVPLLYRGVAAASLDAVPEPLRRRLKGWLAQTTRLNLLHTRELLALVRLFAAEGIPLLPFKGPTLAQELFGDLGLRQFCDLDILVRRRDVERAMQLLTARGYQVVSHVSGFREVTYRTAEHHYECRHPELGTTVELHWAITPLAYHCPIHYETVAPHLREIDFAGVQVPGLDPADTLLLLCVHGSKHRWLELRWICDIAELLRSHQDLEWGVLLRDAARRGCLRMLLIGIGAAHSLLEAPVAGVVLNRIARDRVVGSLVAEVVGQLFVDRTEVEGTLRRWRFHLRMRERLQDQLRYIAASVLLYQDATSITDRDRSFLQLPAVLFPLYYLVRPLRVAAKYIGILRGEAARASATDPAQPSHSTGCGTAR